MTPQNGRLLSGFIILASIGSMLYLMALDAMIWKAVTSGQAVLNFDWLEPAEALFIVPFCIIFVIFIGVRELRRLTAK